MADVTVTFGAADTGLERTLNTIQAELNQLKAEALSGELSVDQLKNTMRQIAQLQGVETRLREIAGATDVLGAESTQTASQVNTLQRELGQTTTVMGGTSGQVTTLRANFNNLATQLAGLYATVQGAQGIFNFLRGAVSDAVDLNEAINRSNVVFGTSAQAIQSWANTAATGIGQSSAAAIGAASDFAVFGRAAGLTGQELIDFSTTLVALAADLASFQNTTPQDAIIALGAALRGESEPIRRYGVLLDDATLKNRAMADGIRDTTTGALTPAQRVLAAYREILEQTSIQQGDFARTSGELANQTRILKAEYENLSAEIGQELVPATLQLVGYLRDLIPVVSGVVSEYRQYAQITNEAGLGTRESADAAGQATGMLDLLGTMVSSVVGPITDLATGTSNYRDAANAAADAARNSHVQIDQVGYSAQFTTTEVAALQSSFSDAFTAGNTEIGQSISLFGSLNPEIASAESGFVSLAANAGDLPAPLGQSVNLFGQIPWQIQGINAGVAQTENLLSGQTTTLRNINSSYESWRDYSERINAEESARQAIYERQKRETAAVLANINNTLNTSLDLQNITFNNISGMGGVMEDAAEDAEDIETVLQRVERMRAERAAEGLRINTQDARQNLLDLGEYLGVNLVNMSYPDIANRLGIDTMGTRGREQVDLINRAIQDMLNRPVPTIQINTNFNPSLVRAPLEEPINLTINGNFDPLQIRRPLEDPINLDLQGGDFVNYTRNLLSQPIDMVFTDGLGFAPMIRQNLSQPVNMSLLSGGFESQVQNNLTAPVNMNLSSSGFENQVQNNLADPVNMNLSSGGFENQVQNNLADPVNMNLSSGGFENQVQNNLTDPVNMNLDGSQGVSQIQQDLSGPVQPQFDFADFDRQWSQVRSTINSQATGGDGGPGGQGGQGGEGGEGGDFDPTTLQDVVTAIEQCRDRLPITTLVP